MMNFGRNSIIRKINYTKISTFSSIEIPVIPPSDPILGNLGDVRLEGGSWHRFLSKTHKRVGPVFYFWVRNIKAVSVGHPKYWNSLSHMHERPDCFRGWMKELTGKKAVNFSNGETRARYGQYISSTFCKEAVVNKQAKIMDKHFALHFPTWIKYAENGEKFPMVNKFDYVAISMMVEILFGVDVFPEEKLIYLTQCLVDTFAELEIRSLTPEYEPEKEKILQEKMKYIKTTILELIDLWEQKPRTEEKNCFLDYLQAENDPEARYSNTMNFIVAGGPTISKVLAYLGYELSRHPDKQRKLQKELDEFITHDGIVTTNNLKGLKYMRACINEALRLYAPATTFVRYDSQNDIAIGDGITIPKGTPFMLPNYHVFLSDEFWKNPLEFRPERYREDGIQYSLQFQPFGFAGGRVCVGKVLADHVLQLVIAGFFKKFTATNLHNNEDLKISVLSTITPDQEIWMNLKLRH